MLNTLSFFLGISLLLNFSGIGLGMYLLLRRGGLSYLSKRLKPLSDANLRAEAIFEGKNSVFSSMPPNHGSIVFLGDSLIDNCPWNELFLDCPIINRGVAGDTIRGALSRVAEVSRHQPRAIFLMIGTNDLHGGHDNLQVAQNYRRLVESLRVLAPQSILVLQSVLPVHLNGEQMSEPRGKNRDVIQLNAEIQKLADGRHIFYCDVHRWMQKDYQLNIDYTYDGLHLSGPGYLRWKEALDSFLSENQLHL